MASELKEALMSFDREQCLELEPDDRLHANARGFGWLEGRTKRR